MKQLLYKEFRLALHPTNLMFLCLAVMVFIPNYPYYVACFFTTLGIQFLMTSGRENRDVAFGLLLPVRKRDLVRARFRTAVFFELAQLALMIPCILVKDALGLPDNAAGIEANPAMLGISLILLGVFNLVFFTLHYRNVARIGVPFLFALAAFIVPAAAAEACTFFLPFFQALDTRGWAFLPEKLAVLCAGALLFPLLTLLSCRRSVRSFEALDL